MSEELAESDSQAAEQTSQAKSESSQEPEKRRGLGDIMQEIFLPIMPALIAAGILQGITSILIAFDVLKEGQPIHLVFTTISSAVFYFLPFLLAPSTAKAFGASPYLAIAVVAFFLSPEMVEAMKSDADMTLLGIPVVKTSYTSAVIPIILMIWGMSIVQRWVNRVTPKMLATILVPTITVAVSTVVGLLVYGPVGAAINDVIEWGVNLMQDHVPWMVPLLVGGLGGLMVSMGLSLALFPVALTQMTSLNYDTVYGPGMLASNIALAGMALAVALKARDPEYKAFSFTASTTALLGVAQPALYGVGLTLRRPYIGVMIGGAAGGLIAGLADFKVYALTPAGLTSIPGWVEPNGSWDNLYVGFLVTAVAFAVSFVVAWIVGYEQPSREVVEEVTGTM